MGDRLPHILHERLMHVIVLSTVRILYEKMGEENSRLAHLKVKSGARENEHKFHRESKDLVILFILSTA